MKNTIGLFLISMAFSILSSAATDGQSATWTLQVEPHLGPTKTWLLEKRQSKYIWNGVPVPAKWETDLTDFKKGSDARLKTSRCEAGRWIFEHAGKKSSGCLEDGSSGVLIRAAQNLKRKLKVQ